MGDVNNNMIKVADEELSSRRSEYLKGLRVAAKITHKTKDMEPLISIQTYNPQKRQLVELVMRTLDDLDSLSAHMVQHYGGHIIPVLSQSVLSNKDLEGSNNDIQNYIVALQRNKYCRQDIHFFCFLIEQKVVFPKQQAYQKALKNAADYSRKYLNTLFTRKDSPPESMKELIKNYGLLRERFAHYREVKQIALIKIKEFVCFEETMGLFAELTAVPCIAVEPHEQEIQSIWKLIKSSDSLISQAEMAYSRWEILIENVRETQSNVYKGLHEDVHQLQIKEKQLREWNVSLDIQFMDLSQYLSDKMSSIAKFIYSVKQKIIDFAIWTSIRDEGENEGEVLWKKAGIKLQDIPSPTKSAPGHRDSSYIPTPTKSLSSLPSKQEKQCEERDERDEKIEEGQRDEEDQKIEEDLNIESIKREEKIMGGQKADDGDRTQEEQKIEEGKIHEEDKIYEEINRGEDQKADEYIQKVERDQEDQIDNECKSDEKADKGKESQKANQKREEDQNLKEIQKTEGEIEKTEGEIETEKVVKQNTREQS